MASSVLDASAVLALLNGEPGAEIVVGALPDAVISCVNLAEVIAKLVEKGMVADVVLTTVDQLQLDTVDLDRPLAVQTGLLQAKTRQYGLSLGDRACLALAAREGLPALTSDRAWENTDVGAMVKLIR